MCLIKDIAKTLKTSDRKVFKLAAKGRFTNDQDVADYRFLCWFKYGEIPDWLKRWWKDHQMKEQICEASAPKKSSAFCRGDTD